MEQPKIPPIRRRVEFVGNGQAEIFEWDISSVQDTFPAHVFKNLMVKFYRTELRCQKGTPEWGERESLPYDFRLIFTGRLSEPLTVACLEAQVECKRKHRTTLNLTRMTLTDSPEGEKGYIAVAKLVNMSCPTRFSTPSIRVLMMDDSDICPRWRNRIFSKFPDDATYISLRNCKDLDVSVTHQLSDLGDLIKRSHGEKLRLYLDGCTFLAPEAHGKKIRWARELFAVLRPKTTTLTVSLADVKIYDALKGNADFHEVLRKTGRIQQLHKLTQYLIDVNFSGTNLDGDTMKEIMPILAKDAMIDAGEMKWNGATIDDMMSAMSDVLKKFFSVEFAGCDDSNEHVRESLRKMAKACGNKERIRVSTPSFQSELRGESEKSGRSMFFTARNLFNQARSIFSSWFTSQEENQEDSDSDTGADEAMEEIITLVMDPDSDNDDVKSVKEIFNPDAISAPRSRWSESTVATSSTLNTLTTQTSFEMDKTIPKVPDIPEKYQE